MASRPAAMLHVPARGLVLGVALALASALPRSASAQGDCPSSLLPQLAPLSAAFVTALHSIDSNTPTNVCFANKSASDVNVYWIDYGPDGVAPGSPVFYQFLAVGQSYWQGTYVTHPWLITDAGTNAPIEGFLPISVDAEADITGSTATPEPSELVLLATGLGALAGVTRRRRRS